MKEDKPDESSATAFIFPFLYCRSSQWERKTQVKTEEAEKTQEFREETHIYIHIGEVNDVVGIAGTARGKTWGKKGARSLLNDS